MGNSHPWVSSGGPESRNAGSITNALFTIALETFAPHVMEFVIESRVGDCLVLEHRRLHVRDRRLSMEIEHFAQQSGGTVRSSKRRRGQGICCRLRSASLEAIQPFHLNLPLECHGYATGTHVRLTRSSCDTSRRDTGPSRRDTKHHVDTQKYRGNTKYLVKI